VLQQRWRVENFPAVMKLSKPGNCLRSTVFRDPAFSDACWQLCLYPGGKREENANNVSLFLKMSATTPSKEVLLKAEYRFYFLDDADSPRFSNINIGDFHAKPPKGGHSWGLRNIPRQKVLSCVREDDSLLISCHIELIPDINKIRCITTRNQLAPFLDTQTVASGFLSSFARLQTDAETADCTIRVAHRHQLRAHKCVLAAHSDVFRAMFFVHSDLRETRESMVDIEDFPIEPIQIMLDYMYTGIAKIDERADEVLALADKYGVEHLKTICEQGLLNRLDRHNVCALLSIADIYSAKHLHLGCVDVVKLNKKAVLSSDEWSQLRETRPHLCLEVVDAVVVGDSSPPVKRSRI